MAEAFHTESFNIEAIARGETGLKAEMNTLSNNDPLTDVQITSSSGDTARFQMKFYGDEKQTARAFRHDRYADNNINKVAPAEQLDGVKTHAKQQALRNQDSRPDVSRNYEHTAQNTKSTISHPENPGVSSRPLNRKGNGGSEDLTKQARQGKKPEYSHSEAARTTQQWHQYSNAAKAGAIGGAVSTTASELIRFMRSDRPLSRNECLAIAGRIVTGSARGAGQALLTTGVQHTGKELLRSGGSQLAKTVGKQLVKGNVAANVALLIAGVGNDLYRFSQGEIDGVEFAESTLSNGTSLAASAAGYAAGTALAGSLGGLVSSSVASYAVAGTTLGALGPVALGVVAAIAASMAVSACVGHFKGQGQQIALDDIKAAGALLNNGQISLGCYAGQVGEMSAFTFRWSDIIPLTGTFSVLGEYSARKKQLMALQQDIASRRAALPEQELQMMYELQAQYQQQLAAIQAQFSEQRREVFQQAGKHLLQLEDELDAHLESRFALQRVALVEQMSALAEQSIKLQRQALHQQQLEFYTQEIIAMREQVEQSDFLPVQEQSALKVVLAQRVVDALPEVTPYDLAEQFMQQEVVHAS